MKTLLLGGSGTLGTALAGILCDQGKEVVVFSRGELAQKQMASRFPSATYIIGDIRDRDAVRQAMRGVDTVFVLAAIKHIDVAEKNPLEALKTNVLGVVNAAEEAMRAGVKHVIFSNTDKAVLPITTYGYTKAIAQNYILSLNGQSGTRFCAYAWGNVVASRGSVIPHFVETLLRGDIVPITDPRMSRFWLTMDQAANFMLSTYTIASETRAMIPPVKAATVVRVVESIARLLGVKNYALGNTGLRGIEKLYEVLESTHEGCLRSDTCEQYTDDELDELLKTTITGLAGDRIVRAARARKLQAKEPACSNAL